MGCGVVVSKGHGDYTRSLACHCVAATTVFCVFIGILLMEWISPGAMVILQCMIEP